MLDFLIKNYQKKRHDEKRLGTTDLVEGYLMLVVVISFSDAISLMTHYFRTYMA